MLSFGSRMEVKMSRKSSKPEGFLFDEINHAMLRPTSLGQDELYAIHEGSLEILAQVGIQVKSEKARDIFTAAGATAKDEIVKIPSYIVEDCIKSAPSVVLLAGRNRKNDYVIKQDKVAFINFGEGVNVIDPYTREYRMSTKEDLGRNTRVADAIDVLPVAYRSVASQDKHGFVQSLHNAEIMFQNTSKHIFIGPAGEANALKIIDMAAEIVGGKNELKQRPIITFNVCPTSPLQLSPPASDVIIEGAKAGIPSNIISMALAGATAPITLAGALVTHNAEVLSAVVLSQLVERGAPVFYGSSTSTMDFRHMTTPVGSPELAMINNAVAQLSRYYLLPSFVAGG